MNQYNQTASSYGAAGAQMQGYQLPPESDLASYGEGLNLVTYIAGALYIVSLTFTFSKTLFVIPRLFTVFWAVMLTYRVLSVGQHRLCFPKPLLVFSIWVIWASFGLIGAELFDYGLKNWFRIVRMLGLAFLAVNSFRSLRQLRFLLYVFIVSELLMVIMGTWQMGSLTVMRTWGWKDAVAGVEYGITNANDLGQVGLFGLVSTVFLFLTTQKGKILERLIQAGGVVLSLYVIYASGSRRQLVNVLILLVLLYFCHMVRGKRVSSGQKILVTFLAIAIFIGALVYIELSPYSDRLDSFKAALTGDFSLIKQESRYVLLFEALGAAVENPIFGLGPGHFRLYSTIMPGQSSHSDLGAVSSETGLVGLMIYVLWYCFWLAMILPLRKHSLPKHHAAMLNCILVFALLLIINAPTSEFFRDKFVWIATGAFMGYCMSLRERITIAEYMYLPMDAAWQEPYRPLSPAYT